MRKFTSIILVTIIFFVVLLSTFYIAFEYEHDCTENECPICCLMEQCESTLKQIKDGIVIGFRINIPIFFIAIQFIYLTTNIITNTLVSNKIRLND